MTTWYTSDLHFHHNNIVKLTNRDVDTTQEKHTEWLIDLWNSQVKPDDTVWHLGDFSFSNIRTEVCDLLAQLRGQKRFVKGNHDGIGVLDDQLDISLNVLQVLDYKETKTEGNTTVLFHYPIGSWNKQGRGSFHLHGHSHGSYTRGRGKILDVGLDSAYNIYGTHRFFSEQDVVEYMQDREIFTSDHHKIITKG